MVSIHPGVLIQDVPGSTNIPGGGGVLPVCAAPKGRVFQPFWS